MTATTETRNAEDPPEESRLSRVRRHSLAHWWWALPALALLVLMHYVAVGVGAGYSFTNSRGLGKATFIGFDNYVKLLTDPDNRVAFVNTIVMAVAFVILTTIAGLGLALMLNRGLKTRYLLRALLFAPVVLSPLAVSYIWAFIYQPNGPLNSLLEAVGLGDLTRTWLGDPKTVVPVIIIVMVWQNMGLTMVIYLAGLANVPAEIEEAAAVDGAGTWQRFWKITFPLLRPSVAISTTLLLVQGLRIFDQVIALTNGGPYGASETLATLVYKYTFVDGRYGYGAALSVLLTILIVIVSLVQQFLQRPKEG